MNIAFLQHLNLGRIFDAGKIDLIPLLAVIFTIDDSKAVVLVLLVVC